MFRIHLLYLAAAIVFASTQATAQQSADVAPRARWDTGNQPPAGRQRATHDADQRRVRKEHQRMSKREEFQMKHRRYSDAYDYRERYQRHQPTLSGDRYEDFQKKRERYHERQELNQFEKTKNDLNSVEAASRWPNRR